MPRYRSRKQAVRKKNLLGIFLILSVLAVFASLAFFRYQLQSQKIQYDSQTLCPINAASPKYIALVFDKSDTYNKVQQQYLRRFFSKFKADLMPGTRISVYVIDNQQNKAIAPDFVVCAPRSGKAANAFYENPKHIRQRWRSQFEQPLDQAIEGFMQTAQSDSSPIMEIFQTISERFSGWR